MELIEHDFTQDEVGEEEKNLAQELKDLCDSGGKETVGTQLEAASIFHKLARIYENKINHKKLNMTRSAALYNAAIVRDPKNQIFKNDLKALCSAVLVKANAAKFDADLIFLAAEVKNKLYDLRIDFGKCFSPVEIIPYGVEDDQLLKLQRKKVLYVKSIQKEVTRSYTELMRFISDECIKIMGAHPCKYAVVGLGSLARSEVTPYSDFEHIIVLENDVAKMKNRKIIMKYFRWFTTIFNIILINLGETMINCVAIPSINPRYRDWFMDHVTPNGVTYDGMVAHACIRPLGRPATKNKPWNTEFIKPVDEMVRYLDSDEQVKQGYHVADVLSKACFVAGDKAIYEQYQEKAHLRIKENDEKNEFSIVAEQMKKDFQNFNFFELHGNAMAGLQNYNIKRAIYRGATLFISFIGRLHSLQASSCFDIIDNLNKIGGCNEEMAQQLRFMVAVACEVRAKVYHLKEQQDDVFMESYQFEDLIPGLIKIVGKQSLLSFVETMTALLKHSKADYSKWNFEGLVVKNSVERKWETFDILQLHEDSVELTKKTISSSQADTFPISIGAVVAAFTCKEFDLVIDTCSKMNYFTLTVNKKFEYKVFELASIVKRSYSKEKQSFEDSRSVVEDKVQELEEMLKTIKPTIGMFSSFITYSETLMLMNDGKIPNTSKVDSIWKQILKLERFTTNGIMETVLLKYYATILMNSNQYTKALKLLDEAKQLIQPYENTTTVPHKNLYHLYADCYYKTNRYYEALICWLECARICKKLKQPISDNTKKESKNTFHLFILRHPNKILESASNIDEPTEALKLLDEAKQMMQSYKITTTKVHMLLYLLYATCYNNTDRYYESFICWLKFARIYKKFNLPIDNEFKKNTNHKFYRFIFRHPFKLCESAAILIINGEYKEALKRLHKAKKIMQSYKVATTLEHRLLYHTNAVCYHYTNRYYEALICWLECARICKKLKQPIHDDIKRGINQTFQQIFRHPNELYESAVTLMINGKPTEALKLLDKVKQLMQRCKNTTTVAHMALYGAYAICYHNTGRYYKAFICWLEYARICKKRKGPISDNSKHGINLTFQQIIFRHSIELCKSAERLINNGKPTEVLKLLDEAKQMMQRCKNTTTVVQMQLYKLYSVCYLNSDGYYKALICCLEYARIGKKRKEPIPDYIKQRMKDTFQTFIFRHPMKLCESAESLMNIGKHTDALKLLDEAKLLMQPYKNTTTVMHMRLYYAHAVYYNNSGRNYDSFICWLEYVRICKKLKQPIPDNIKQDTKLTFQQLLFDQTLKLCKSAETLINNGKPTKALKLLDKAKQRMQPRKNTTTLQQ